MKRARIVAALHERRARGALLRESIHSGRLLVRAAIVLALCARAVSCGPSSEASGNSEGASAHSTGASAASGSVRHVILITLDTLRADKTTPYGCAHDTTPNLARFAKQAVQFDRAYTVMPTTGPAHISILTGLYPEEHGSLRNGIPARSGIESLPALLARGGRKTAAFVSALHLAEATTGVTGFETWNTPKGVRDGARTVDLATQWIASHEREPFFLWVHLFDPHAPYEAHAGLSDELEALLVEYQGVSTRGSYRAGEAVMSKEEAEKRELLYEADVYYTDQQIGRLLDFLDAHGIGDQDLVAIVADHGELMTELLASEKYAFDHGEHLLPGEIHVPMWIRMPGARPGSVESSVVETKDLFGAILEATNTRVSHAVPALPIPRGASATTSAADAAKTPSAGVGSRSAPTSTSAIAAGIAFVARHVDPEPKSNSGPLYAAVDAATLTIWSGEAAERARFYELATDPLALADVVAKRPELAADRQHVIAAWRARLVHQGVEGSTQEMSTEMKRALDALGY